MLALTYTLQHMYYQGKVELYALYQANQAGSYAMPIFGHAYPIFRPVSKQNTAG